jgi:hypothetical protein
LALHGYDLPDTRRAEDYRLRAWWRPRDRHHLSIELHYVGIEDAEHLIYAGGPFGVQWSLELPRLAGLLWASDVSARLPVGDGAFHPVSAKASSFEWNLRAGVATDTGRLWGSWWVRRVSQPTDRVEPQSYFPSGSGATVYGSFDLGGTVVYALARQDSGGASSVLWLGAGLDFRLSDELTLGAGFSGQPPGEAADERLFDRGWALSIRWNPAPLQAE